MDAWELGMIVSVAVGVLTSSKPASSDVVAVDGGGEDGMAAPSALELSEVASGRGCGGGVALPDSVSITAWSIGLVHCSSYHPVCSLTVSQILSSDCKLSSLPCNTNHHLSLPDLVDCLLRNFRLT